MKNYSDNQNKVSTLVRLPRELIAKLDNMKTDSLQSYRAVIEHLVNKESPTGTKYSTIVS